MAIHQLITSQKIPTTKMELWNFISSPSNLKRITPSKMGFDITSKDLSDNMYPGMIITYQVRPLLNIPTTWVTEITHIDTGKYFVDEQRVGPYRMWHHEHHLIEITGGVEMRDIITYKAPFGLIGKLANWLFIKKQLNAIFSYRERALTEIFGRFEE